MSVRDLIDRNYPSIYSDAFATKARATIRTRGLRVLPVMDVLKFFGSGKVFEHLQSGTVFQVLQTPILEIAIKEATTIETEADVAEATRLMQQRNVGALPVVKNGKLVGVITERDFFKLIA